MTMKLLCLSLVLLWTAITANELDTLIGIVGRDFVVLAADSSASQSISVTTSGIDRIRPVCSPDVWCAAAGDFADADQITGKLQALCALKRCEEDYGSAARKYGSMGSDRTSTLSPTVGQVAHLARYLISQQLRSSSGPFNVNILVAGMTSHPRWTSGESITDTSCSRVQQQVRRLAGESMHQMKTSDDATGSKISPSLYWLDRYGSCQRMHQYGAHGHGANFLLSLLDQGYRPDLSREEAVHLVEQCFEALRQRYLINIAAPPFIKCIDAHGCLVVESDPNA